MWRMDSEAGPGDLIRRARQERRWKQEDLARAVGVSVTTVNRWERGKHPPSRHAARVEQVLGISFRAASPARRTAAAMTDDQRAEVMQELLRLTQALADDDAIRLELDQPEDKPPERSRRAG